MTDTKHSIGAVARRTGLSTYLIRVWEKRYGATEPARSETGRRLYSDQEISRLTLLKQATEMGESIGQIAKLSDEALKSLVAAGQNPAFVSAGEPTGYDQNVISRLSDDCLDSVRNLDANALENILNHAAVAVSKPILLEKILCPLMYKIGDLWREGQLRVVHEHLASAVVRTFLGNLSSTYRPSNNSPAIVITTPIGQWHEFGALMVVISVLRAGWRAVYLGPNIPAEEIASAVVSNHARAAALSLIYPAEDPDVERELVKLRKYLGPDINIFIGGRAAESYADVIKEIGAIRVFNMSDFQKQFDIKSSV